MKLRPGFPLLLGLTVLLTAFLGCAPDPKEKAAKHLRVAEEFFAKRDYLGARLEYFNALRQDPTNALALQRLAKIFFAQGQIHDAYPLLLRSEAAFPEDLQIREHLVVLFSTDSDPTNRAKMRDEAEYVLTREPTNYVAWAMLASAARTPDELSALESRVAAVRQQTGDHAVFHLVDADRLLKSGDTNAVEAAFQRALELGPDLPYVQQSYGSYLSNVGRPAEAEVHLKRAAELSPPYGTARMAWARFLQSQGREEEAKTVLQAITDAAPEQVGAWVARADIALRQGQLEEAEKLVTQALTQAPLDAEAQRILGQVRFAQKRPQDALKAFELALKRISLPKRPQVLYLMAAANLQAGDTASAIDNLKLAREFASNVLQQEMPPEASLLLAELGITGAGGGTDEAIPILTDLTNRFPRLDRAAQLLVSAEIAANRPEAALQAALAAQARFPNNPAYLFQVGALLRRQNRPQDARQAFSLGARMTTNAPAFVEQLVAMDLAAGQFDAALSLARQSQQQRPDQAAGWLFESRVHRARKEIDAAEAALRLALEKEPNSLACMEELTQLYVTANKLPEAIQRLEGYLQQKTNDFTKWTGLAQLKMASGDVAGATEAYEKALEFNPDYPEALNDLAYLLGENSGDLSRAYDLASRARNLAPGDPRIADTLGWIEYRRKRYRQAAILLTEAADKISSLPALELRAALPSVLFHLGMVQSIMGQEEAARASFSRAVASGDDFPGKDLALDRLALLKVPTVGTDPNPDDLALLEKRASEDPEDLIARLRLGDAYRNAGKFDKALEQFEAAQKINPDSVAPLGRLATLYADHLKDPARAMELAREFRQRAPNDPQAARILGRLLLASGEYSAAYSLLQECARRLGDQPDVAADLAWAAFSQGRLDEAGRLMQNVMGTAGSPEALKSEARTFVEMLAIASDSKATPQAASQVQQVLEAKPDFAPALMAYGVLAEAQGKPDDARTVYERLLSRFPTFAPAARQLALLYGNQLNDDAKAYDLGIKARQAYPRDPELAGALGKVICRRGDYRYAIQLLQEANRSQPKDASLHYYLGVAYAGVSQTAESITALTQALSLEPQAPFAEDARKRLAALDKEGAPGRP